MTEAQEREFRETLEGLSEYKEILPKIKELPKQVNDLRRMFFGRGGNGTRTKGALSDNAARGLGSVFLIHLQRSGKLDEVFRDTRERDSLLIEARSFGGRVTRDMSTTEIPLPEVYGTELLELIAELGVARKHMFPWPMVGGENKPPRWGTRPAFGSIAMGAQFAEKKPTLEFASLTSKKLGGIVYMPRELQEQSLVNIGQMLARYGAVEFARGEDTWAFLADGTGTYESVSGICKIAADAGKKTVLDAGNTKPSDATLEDFRDLRRRVSTAALSKGKYFLNQSWEGYLRSFNTINDPQIFVYKPDGTASLDGFEIVWTEVLQPYIDTAAPSTNLAVFGRLEYWFFGQRGLPRMDVSEHFKFDYDMLTTRFLEELDFDYASIEAASVLQTPAA